MPHNYRYHIQEIVPITDNAVSNLVERNAEAGIDHPTPLNRSTGSRQIRELDATDDLVLER